MNDWPSGVPHAIAIVREVAVGWWWMLIAVWFQHYYSRSWGIGLFALFSLPGTLAHELAHWLVAFVLGGQPDPPSIWPRRMRVNNQEFWQLGEVKSHLSWWRGPFVGLAPLLLIPVGIWLLWFGLNKDGWLFWLTGWFGSVCLISSWPSKEDWILAFSKGGVALILAVGTVSGLLYFFR